jgi:diaminopropionate ammonia-lyase
MLSGLRLGWDARHHTDAHRTAMHENDCMNSATAPRAHALVNPAAAARGAACPSRSLSRAGFAAALAEISSWPGYAPTTLLSLPGLARRLGVGQVLYKDERGRFGLGSFKALGGAYAVANVLRHKAMAARGLDALGSSDLLSGAFDDVVGAATVCCATDGNHGRAVAWGAQLFGCRCVIFVHEQVSQGRRDAIARYGAEVREVKGNYDDAVRHAAASAAAEGWSVVSDTSYPGYRDIPLDVMHGYGVLAAEVVQQLADGPLPTHVFAQAGVGALAASVCANFWLQWGGQRPRFVVVEPMQADCVMRSLAAGQPVAVGGALDTVMAGLACGEVSELAWEVLHTGANAALALSDEYALEAMRVLANPVSGDVSIVAGETGGAGLAALLAAQQHAEVRAALDIDASSRVLLIGSEGDTDPAIYREVVGRTAAEVLV